MKLPIFIVLVGVLAQQGFAFQCDPTYIRDCGGKATYALKNAAEQSEKILMGAVVEMVDEVNEIYSMILPVFSQVELVNKTIRIGNNTIITIKGNIDAKQAAQILEQLTSWLEELQKLTGGLIPGGMEAIKIAVQQIINELTNSTNTYGLIDINLLREQLRNALAQFKPIVRTIVMKALDLVGSRIERLTGRVRAIVSLIPGLGEKWSKIEAVIQAVIEKVKAKAENKLTYMSLDDDLSLWEKVKAAASKLANDVRATVQKAIDENKPKIIEGLKNIKDVIINAGKKILIQINGEIVKVIVGEEIASSDVATYGVTDLWSKVKAAAEKLSGQVKDRVKEAINNLKPKILESLNRVKEIVIDAGKKVIIQVRGDIVRIITDALTTESDSFEYVNFGDLWGKVKNAANKLSAGIRADVMKILEEYKPKVLDDLKKLQKTFIEAGKKVFVSIKNNVVKVIVGEVVASSDEITVQKRSVSDLWAKVKAAAENLDAKVRDQVKATIEKFKPKIIDGLNRVKEVIIDSGKKIVITIRDEIVRIIAGADVVEGKVDATYGFQDKMKEAWEKVKNAAKQLTGKVRTIVVKIIAENKPLILAELNKMKEVLIQAGKKVLIQITHDVARIIVGDSIAYSDETALYGFRDAWAKVTAAIKKFNEDTKNFFKSKIDALKPKIVAAVEKMKAKFGEWNQVIVDGAKKVWVKVDATGMKIAADFNNVMDKVRAAAEKLDDKVRAEVQAAIAKFEPKIVEGLNNVKQVILDSGKKIVITIRDEIVRIIAGADVASEALDVTYGFKEKMKEVWQKVKDAAKKLAGKTKTIVLKIVEENKPFIMEQLKKIKEAVIEAGKKVVIQITHDVVKIIIGESVSYSDDAIMYRRSLRDLWGKVTSAIKKFNQETKDYFKSKIEALKPKIVKLLEDTKAKFGEFKEVVVDGAEKVWVKLDAAGVKIVADLKKVWGKVEEAVKNARADIKAKVEEYKPKIIEALNNFKDDVEDFKDFVIDGAKKIHVRITAAGVQIVEDARDVWGKVKVSVQGMSDDVRAFVEREVEKYKPLIIARLNKFQTDVEAFKEFVIDGSKKIYVRISEFGVEIVEDAKNVWGQVQESVKDFSADAKAFIKAKLEKAKPKIIAALNQFKSDAEDFRDFVVDGAKKIYVRISAAGVKVVADAKDVFTKVQAAAEKLDDTVRAEVKAAIEKYMPLIIEQLNNGKQAVIDAAGNAKKVIIDLKGKIVSVITGAESASSDEEFTLEKRAITDVWEKVKAAMKKLGSDIAESSKKIVEEYKPKIIDALNKMKEIVINAGKQMVIRINGEIVKVIVDGKVAEA